MPNKPHNDNPRPGFGGKQPGAGRPIKPVTDKPVAVVLDPDTARLLDAKRGKESRREYLRSLLAVCDRCDSTRCECRS